MIDPNDFGFSSLHIWRKVINGEENVTIDVYYIEAGFPKHIHDKYGAKEVERFEIELIETIKSENHSDNIWRVLPEGYAVPSKSDNIAGFSFTYKEFTFDVLKKTVAVQLVGAK